MLECLEHVNSEMYVKLHNDVAEVSAFGCLRSVATRLTDRLLWVAVSMGRRNTCLKPSILVVGPDGLVGAS